MKFTKTILFLLGITVIISCDKEGKPDEPTNPSTFNLLLVVNNATDVSFTPTFTWQESTDPNGGVITYDLYIQKENEVPNNSLPTQLYQTDITTNTYTLTSPLLAETTYKWYVKSKNSTGGSTNSNSVFSFTTAGIQNLPPNLFSLLSPANNAIDIQSDPTLTWQAATDPENDPVVYDVYLGINSPDNRIAVGLTQPTLKVGSLLSNTVYAWYVVAQDNAGNIRNSSTFTFTTGDGSASGSNSKYTLISSSSLSNKVGRFGHQMVDYDGKLWIIGGTVLNADNTGGEYNDVWSSSDLGVTWTKVKENTPEVGFVRSDEHQAVVFRNEIWVLNGNRNTVHKSNDGVTWSNVSFSGNVSQGTHYAPRQNSQAVVFNDKLYLIGGNASGILKNDVWSTDGVLNDKNEITWIEETSNAGFEPRYGHQVTIFNNKFYLAAGMLVGNQRMNDIWTSTDGKTWESVTDSAPFTTRFEHVLVTDKEGQAMWLLGGHGINPDTGTTVAYLNDVWYSKNGVDWVEAIPHKSNDTGANDFRGRREFAAVAADNLTVITMGKFGGGQNLLNDTWHLKY